MADNRFLKIKLLVGLGNPGEKYKHTYHNAGKLFADELVKYSAWRPSAVGMNPGRIGLKFRQPAAPKNFGYLKIGNFTFIRPLAFMNESGAVVQAALKFFKTKPKELLVIHDDSDIEIGKYKISFGRGAAGHRGIESIIQKIKTRDFWRLRIGIRPLARMKAAELVLKKINSTDEKILDSAFRKIRTEFFQR